MLLSLVVASCGGTSTPDEGHDSTTAGTAIETEGGSQTSGTVRILTFNIRFGGELDPDALIEVILAHDADIIGLQEANGWDRDEFARAEQLATALGMEYAYCKAYGDADSLDTFDTIIFSRFEILREDAYPWIAHCMGVAGIRLTDGRRLEVVNVHLKPGACRELLDRALTIVPYTDGVAVMLGDFNFSDLPSLEASDKAPPLFVACNEKMSEAGWTYLSGEPLGQIDHIWVSKPLADLEYVHWSTPNYLVEQTMLARVSDHRPVAVDLVLAP